jgi:hypothetical protein
MRILDRSRRRKKRRENVSFSLVGTEEINHQLMVINIEEKIVSRHDRSTFRIIITVVEIGVCCLFYS